MSNFVLAVDQGTTSTRAIVFNRDGEKVASSQKEHEQIFPHPGWVEHNPAEIWANTQTVISGALREAGLGAADIAAIGITNQRETTMVWDSLTGKPVYNALVWQDTRTQAIVDRLAGVEGVDRYKASLGLPLATYFSATKIIWILENVPGAREKADAGQLRFGTMDTWLLWNLTGGLNGGLHLTDVTNASRTLLMDLQTLNWRTDLLQEFGIPISMLPRIVSSSEIYGAVAGESELAGVPIAGILGDQQAATFGQAAFDAGESKNTYGTGNFLMFQTGEQIVQSKNGLLTTVGFKLGDAPARYALEGSIAVTGSLIQWLRDNLGLFASSAEVEELAKTVPDNGGAYFVPAFSGLFAPYWRPDARGVLAGLTRFVNRGHIARAALEAAAYQTRDVLDAVNADAGVKLTQLKVDGGMTANETLMQFQADILGVPVVRPVVTETTALGAAYVAGLAVGFWSGLAELRTNWHEDQRWNPTMPSAQVEQYYRDWQKAVTKTLGWVDPDAI
ncbi:glycerol kinase GlpK [Rhodoluna sp. KAS3]|uniref:glycerol kinase GlpK n=1 Tax=Rhodoluna sp. KAS3 TaxID=942880 RepID=UPI00222EFE5A|nr:glycerol kinase GlpK [Rhodoluna sp. KAS3]BDS49441.1 glycerol kinase [Rhodoluna sp. KAS3]